MNSCRYRGGFSQVMSLKCKYKVTKNQFILHVYMLAFLQFQVQLVNVKFKLLICISMFNLYLLYKNVVKTKKTMITDLLSKGLGLKGLWRHLWSSKTTSLYSGTYQTMFLVTMHWEDPWKKTFIVVPWHTLDFNYWKMIWRHKSPPPPPS